MSIIVFKAKIAHKRPWMTLADMTFFDDVHSVLKLLYAPMYTHNVIAKKGIKTNLWPLIIRELGPIEAEVCFLYRAHSAVSYIKYWPIFISLPHISQNEHNFCNPFPTDGFDVFPREF